VETMITASERRVSNCRKEAITSLRWHLMFKRLTQTEFAVELKTHPPLISKIMNSKWEQVPLHVLARVLCCVDYYVCVVPKSDGVFYGAIECSRVENGEICVCNEHGGDDVA